MQAAIAPSAGQIRAVQRRPGWKVWMLMLPMLLWLAAFVVLPTAILFVYSLCERGSPVEYRLTQQNYLRVVAGTKLAPLFPSLLFAGVIAIAAMLVDWFRPSTRSTPERMRSVRRVGILAAAIILLWTIWANLTQVFPGTYVRIFVRSIYYAGFTALVCAVVGYPVAYFIGRATERRRNQLLTLIMIPFWTSFLIRTYAWITILSENGLLNAFLQYTRLISEPFSMLYTPGAVLVGLIYSYLPFMILPIYGSVEKLDTSLVEAAFDLGAGPVRVFQTVILPLTQPGIIAGVLLVFIPSIGMFAITDLMGGKTVPMIGNVIQNQFFQARDWPFGAALGMTLLVMFMLAFWFSTRKQGQDAVMG
jgi:spermidine/putrescine transport system permease protein